MKTTLVREGKLKKMQKEHVKRENVPRILSKIVV